ncbi:ACT domain-containing protein ACR10 isoform X2 [Phragmites australis]|uniref:ACT domain-containing protein ACR10 isoform X2 n=1 Tax=Phragmites australis TaxID=29695 RepID=UPI002D79D083|nr:ACT domain-containing protein ACR10 isoform X2 [Phragmites australis]
MGIPSDEVVQIRHADVAGEPTVVTVSCPDKTGLGCDLCRVVLLFGLNIVKGDMSTDGKWCYIVLWVVPRRGRPMAWHLLKNRLSELCPVTAPFCFDTAYLAAACLQDDVVPRVFLLKLYCYDRMGLLHDVTRVLCELELTIRRVKVSTTPDGSVLDLFFITDVRELLHTKSRREEAYDKLESVLGDSLTSCKIDPASDDMCSCLQPSASLTPAVMEQMFSTDVIEEQASGARCNGSTISVTMDNSLSSVHTLIQIQCGDHKGLLYDIMRTLKDCNIQISYGRFYARQNGSCEVDLFVVQSDGKKILDQQKQRALCSLLRMELYRPLRVAWVNRGPDTELLVANPVEVSGKGRPLVFYDITLALKNLHKRIFLAEIGRHVVEDREWEVYRVHFGEEHELSSSLRRQIVDGVTNMLMGWD